MGTLSIKKIGNDYYTALLKENAIYIYQNDACLGIIQTDDLAIQSVDILLHYVSNSLRVGICYEGSYSIIDIATQTAQEHADLVKSCKHFAHNETNYSLLHYQGGSSHLFKNEERIITFSERSDRVDMSINAQGELYVALYNAESQTLKLYNEDGDELLCLNESITSFGYYTQQDMHFFLILSPHGNRVIKTDLDHTDTIRLDYEIDDVFAVADETDPVFALRLPSGDLKLMRGHTIIHTYSLPTTVGSPDHQADYASLTKLGHGTFGDVYKTTYGGRKIAVKQYKDSDSIDAREERDIEATILSQLQHENIIELLGIGSHLGRPHITMPLAENGSLDQYIDRLTFNDKWLPEYNDIAYGVACALDYLHGNRIIHLDLKTGNILLDANLKPMITDLGFAAQLPDDSDHVPVSSGGTHVYMPPELLSDSRHDQHYVNATLSTDIYSFGCILYELGRHVYPWATYKKKDVFQYVTSGLRKNPMPYTPKPIYQLIMQCYSHTPEKRPTASVLMQRFSLFKQRPIAMQPYNGGDYDTTINIHEYEAEQERIAQERKATRQRLFSHTTSSSAKVVSRYVLRDRALLALKRQERLEREQSYAAH